ncbi:MAG: hypothetical protein COA69_09595 [Robiginitomaculum sp.]|nr:MAG: hypothetical protein COA69_09595 [Robiginitomaculum sp.]
MSTTILANQISEAVEDWCRTHNTLFAIAARWVTLNDNSLVIRLSGVETELASSFHLRMVEVWNDYHEAFDRKRRRAVVTRR